MLGIDLLVWEAQRERLTLEAQAARIEIHMQSVTDGIAKQMGRAAFRWDDGNYTTLQGREIPIAVNISPRHFLRSDFVARFNALLAEAGLPQNQAPWLTIEITERVFFEPTEQVLMMLRQLNNMGVRIAIDDFSIGYSSLYYLKELPIRILKIDRIFIQNLATHENDRKLLRALIGIGNSMDLSIVTEGVETEAQRACLEEYQCLVMQGFLFAPAIPPEQLLLHSPLLLAALAE